MDDDAAELSTRPNWQCRVFGHQYTFRAQGPTMVWECTRGCAAGGSKTYSSAAAAARYAAAFDKRDTDDLGKRAPLIGLLPLRLWRRWRDKARSETGNVGGRS